MLEGCWVSVVLLWAPMGAQSKAVRRWEYYIENFLGSCNWPACLCCSDIYEMGCKLWPKQPGVVHYTIIATCIVCWNKHLTVTFNAGASILHIW
jgi:hypothetical protein